MFFSTFFTTKWFWRRKNIAKTNMTNIITIEKFTNFISKKFVENIYEEKPHNWKKWLTKKFCTKKKKIFRREKKKKLLSLVKKINHLERRNWQLFLPINSLREEKNAYTKKKLFTKERDVNSFQWISFEANSVAMSFFRCALHVTLKREEWRLLVREGLS